MHLGLRYPCVTLLLVIFACAIPTRSFASGLVLKPSAVWFDSTDVGQTKTVAVKLSNTGSSTVYLTKTAVSGAQFRTSSLIAPFYLAAGRSKAFTVTFHPGSRGSFDGSVFLWRKGTTVPLVLALHGKGVTGSLVASPQSQNFGTVALGSRKTLQEVLSNRSSAAITITKLSVPGGGFSFGGLTVPKTLAVGQSYTFSISFTPKIKGSQAGSLLVSSNPTNSSLKIGLAGSGGSSTRLSLGTSSLNFGTVPVGSSKSLSGVLAASGGSVRISSATSTSTEFTLRGISFPLTVASGQRVPFMVQFTPKLGGAASGRVSFSSNAQNSPVVQNLAGIGGASGQHRVVLRWKASTSRVSGYHVYRSTSSGGPYSKINASLTPSTNFTDDTVQSGKTYFYVIRAANSKGALSRYSNQVKAVVP